MPKRPSILMTVPLCLKCRAVGRRHILSGLKKTRFKTNKEADQGSDFKHTDVLGDKIRL